MNIENITWNITQLAHNDYFQQVVVRISEINHPLLWIWLMYFGLKMMANFDANKHISSKKNGTTFEATMCTIIQSLGFWLVLIVVSKIIYILIW